MKYPQFGKGTRKRLITNFFSIFVPMDLAKRHIIQQLERMIRPLEGLKVFPSDVHIDLNVPELTAAFPQKVFPVGCIHECIADSRETAGAGYGFMTFLLSEFMKQGGPALWVSRGQTVFPPALQAVGIPPHHVIFIHLKQEKDILFAFEEALKCDQFVAVIGEVRDLDFKQSRRLQLAAEKSRVTGFLFRQGQKSNQPVATVARWKITSLPSSMPYDMPGVGYARWLIDLQKIRNGSPGKWQVEHRPDGIYAIEDVFTSHYNSKTG